MLWYRLDLDEWINEPSSSEESSGEEVPNSAGMFYKATEVAEEVSYSKREEPNEGELEEVNTLWTGLWIKMSHNTIYLGFHLKIWEAQDVNTVCCRCGGPA